MEFKFENGQKVKDTITGFQGVIVARTQWINGCTRYVVQSRKRNSEGKTIDDTIDEQQLVSMEKPKKLPKRDTGGPMPCVKKFSGSHLSR